MNLAPFASHILSLCCESNLFALLARLFCFFVCLLFVCGSCKRKYFMERQKKMQPISCEKQQRSLRESLIICNSSLWSLAASQPLKCMKHPCILMINSPFGLASSCIFLLAAMRRILINSRKGSKNKGGALIGLEGVRRQEKFRAWDTWHPYGASPCTTWAFGGQHEDTEAASEEPRRRSWWTVEGMISTLGIWLRAGQLKV